MTRIRGLVVGVATALLAAWALITIVSSQTPIGAVRGVALTSDLHGGVGGAEVQMYPVGESGFRRRSRFCTAEADGSFSFAGVAAGYYEISASSRARTVGSVTMLVSEGSPTHVTLALEKSQPELVFGRHAQLYNVGSEVRLPLRGYLDDKAIDGRAAVKVKVYRTSLAALFAPKGGAAYVRELMSDKSARTTSLSIEVMNRESGAPTLLKEIDVDAEAKRDGFFTVRAALGSMQPGAYLVEANYAHRAASDLFFVSNTGLVVKRSPTEVTAFAVDLPTGRELPSANVTAYVDGKVRAKGRTNTLGVCTLKLGIVKSEDHLMMVASRADQEAVASQNYYYSEDYATKYKLHIYTERPVYRPGQRVFLKGIARRIGAEDRLSTAQGQTVAIQVSSPDNETVLDRSFKTNSFGSFAADLSLSPEAPTGQYEVTATIGGERHSSSISVASYSKPEFEVKVTPEKAKYVAGEPVKVTLSAKYYFGSPVVGASVSYYVYRSPSWSAEYPDGDYDDEELSSISSRFHGSMASAYGEEVVTGQAELDEAGQATLTLPALAGQTADDPQEQTYSITAMVTDSANREVSGNAEINVSASDYRLSISTEGSLAEPGAPFDAKVSLKTLDGKPAAGVDVSVETGVESWRSNEKTYSKSSTVTARTDAEGNAVVRLSSANIGEVRLIASAVDSSRRSVFARSYVWVCSDAGGDLPSEYSDLSILADKRRYTPGQTARVAINCDRVGQSVLLTVEGDRVYKSHVVQIRQKSTVTRIPVLAEYGPNVTLAACYLQGDTHKESSTSLRVSVPARELSVNVAPTKSGSGSRLPQYEPGEAIEYRIKTLDSAGRPTAAEISLSVVDEAIYALQEDDPNAMRDSFYPHRYNKVETYFSFDTDYLGDADKGESLIVARKNFPDTAYWNPSIVTDVSGSAVVKFSLPDNITTWRATAVGHTKSTALGRGISKAISTKRFFVRLQKPRFLVDGDQCEMVGIVHNETDSPIDATTQLTVTGLSIAGSARRQVHVAPRSSGEARWNVKSISDAVGKVRLTAWSAPPGGAGRLTDGVEMPLPMRARARETYYTLSGELTAAAPVFEVIRVDGAAGSTGAVLRIEPGLRSAIAGAADYLREYPYGCSEQTTTRLIAELERNGGSNLDAASKANVAVGITRLAKLQHSSGAWGWWEAGSDDPWMTAYVMAGLAKARDRGIELSSSMLERSLKAAKELAVKADADDRAFLLFAIARLGDRAFSKKERLSIATRKLTSVGYSYLARLDVLLGESGAANIEALSKLATRRDGFVWFGERGYGMNSSEARTAIALAALHAAGAAPQDQKAMVRWLMRRRTQSYWQDTHTTAEVILALSAYVGPETTPSDEPIQITLDDTVVQNPAAQSAALRGQVVRIPTEMLTPGRHMLRLTRATGSEPVYYSVEIRRSVAAESMPSLEGDGISIKRNLFRFVPGHTADNRPTLRTEAAGTTIKAGEQLRVRLTLVAKRELDYVIIRDAFPAGFETTERGSEDEVVEWGYWWDAIDIRDDHIAFFARSLPKGTHTIEYNVRAQTLGEFRWLPALVQPMYSPSVKAETSDARVSIR